MQAETQELSGIALSDQELVELTGYKQPAKQLAELKRQGFWRARRSILGAVVLERIHYEAVSQGADAQPSGQRRRPQLRPA